MPTLAEDDFILLTHGAAEVAAFTGRPPPNGCYNKMRFKAYDAAFPAVLRDGRWGFYRKDLPAVCAALGMNSDELAA